MPHPPEFQIAVHRFARRTAVGSFLGGSLRGVAVVAALAAGVLLLVRALGGGLMPSLWWALLPLPALGYGLVQLRAQRLTPAEAAAHLDQRLSLHGLLVAATELGELEPSWQGALQRGLADQERMRPRPVWSRLLPWPLASSALFGLVCLLPPPAAPAARLPSAPAVEQQLQELQRQFAELQQAPLPEPVQQELQQKLQELEHKIDAGEVPQWRDLDQLQARLDREKLLQQAQALDAAQAAGQLGQAGAAAPSAEGLAQKLDALAKAGLLDKLPPELLAKLAGMKSPSGGFDPAALGQDPAGLQALADALAQAAGDLALGFDPSALDGKELADLQAMLQRFPKPEHVHGPECEGGT
jgi:hypothetical protein